MSRKEPTLPPSERGLSGEKPPPPPAPPPARCLHSTIGYCYECARSIVMPIGHSEPIPPPTVAPLPIGVDLKTGLILFMAPEPKDDLLLPCPFCGVAPASAYADDMASIACMQESCNPAPEVDVYKEGAFKDWTPDQLAAECRRLWNHRPALEVELRRHGLNPNLFTEPKP